MTTRPAVSGCGARSRISRSRIWTSSWFRTAVVCCCVGSAGAAAAFELGVVTHLGHGTQDGAATLDALAELGATAIRDEAFWSRVERTPHEFALGADMDQFKNFLPKWRERGGSSLLIGTYGNRAYGDDQFPLTDAGRAAYARYARFLTDRFGAQMSYLEVWNEWNRAFGLPKSFKGRAGAADYVKVLEQVAGAMPQGAQRPKLVAGAVEGRDDAWVDEFVAAGGLRWADYLSLHPYVHHSDDPPEVAVRWLDRLRQRIEQKHPEKLPPFLITEIGWPVGTGHRYVDEETAAAFLVRFLLLARTRPWIEGVWWYSLELSSNPNARFSLVRAGGRKTAAYGAFKALAPYIKRTVSARQRLVDGVYEVSLELDRGRRLTAYWKESAGGPGKRIALPSQGRDVRIVWGRDGHDPDAGAGLRVTTVPVLIEHGAARPTLAATTTTALPLQAAYQRTGQPERPWHR